jgi:glycosyltransferase involved in cell wall biosynthesis
MIVHASTTHRQFDNRIYKNECLSLVKQGYKVSIIVPRADVDIENNVKFHQLNIGTTPWIRASVGVFLVFFKALQLRPTVLHIHDPELLLAAFLLKLATGCRIVYDAHENYGGMIRDASLSNYVKELLIGTLDMIYRIALPKFDLIVTVCPSMAERYKTYNDKILVLQNYPRMYVSKEASNEALQNNKFKILYSGTVISQSIILNALLVLRESVDIEYHIAGYYSDDFVKMVREKGLEHNVVFHGLLTRDELELLSKSCHCGIQLLEYNHNVGWDTGTMGNTKVFDYLGFGLPIIVTDFKIWQENILNKYECGIAVRPDGVNELVDAVTFYITHETIRETHASNALKAFEREFNYELIEQNLLNAYTLLLKK